MAVNHAIGLTKTVNLARNRTINVKQEVQGPSRSSGSAGSYTDHYINEGTRNTYTLMITIGSLNLPNIKTFIWPIILN